MYPRVGHLRAVRRRVPQASGHRLFCREPDEQDDAVKLLPEAVIEVVSQGYEAKDLEIAPRFYLSQGVKDVRIFDPSTLLVLHVTAAGARRLLSPAPIELACGCSCTA